MIVRILSSSASFQGVRYNTNKIDRNKGELMKVANFGPLRALHCLRPEDYANYLKMLSAQNKRVKGPQFHAVISCKGKELEKEGLTELAEKWLIEMGYGKQPYLIVFHKDTGNNHVHIVSTRIGRDGKKISSGFEHIRAIQNLNRVMSLDDSLIAKEDMARALNYRVSTKAQFLMILELKGYLVKDNWLVKFGKKQAEIDFNLLNPVLDRYCRDEKKQARLKSIFKKYKAIHSTILKPGNTSQPGGLQKNTGGYTSNFAGFLKEKFGIDLIFHARDGKPPYGYTVIDHTDKSVWKGSEICALKQLISSEQIDKNPLLAIVTPINNGGPELENHSFQNIQINISPDMDDEAVHGRKRKKRKNFRL